ncbi:prevent-host-death protein [Scytonema hofmannii PCC 7110]|uniref:Antitoxin n=1 Tax=Scytonema hofmannii PCC 7110 TaxID=128403 RepID=A0A139X011_9CYAN|nr:type II toxin-antitoxin system Phd/YefM family antitoxin [Scytonema hofmannii]KYC38041.1 prevent-host-death protein [Scytonema hofmannii PCC 7110]
MLDISRGINSLSNFKRNTTEFMEQLRKTGKPVVLTVNGKAELVVQDVESYQKLLELVERLETIEAVKVALQEMKEGKGEPVDEVFKEIMQSLDEK